MSARRFAVLAGVAVVALAAALWSSSTRQPEQSETGATALVPGLEQGINEVHELRVRGAGDLVLATLTRGEQGWTLKEKGDHAVDVSRVRDYLVKLAQARRVEAKTSNPDLYDRLGVESVSAPDAYGAQLEIEGLAAPVKLVVGRNVTRGDGTYVRFADEAVSWQASANLALERSAANWLVKDVIDIASGRIARVEVTPAEGAAVVIERKPQEDGGDFVLAPVPRGREPASAYVADGLGGLLGGLRFDDVFPAAERSPPDQGVTRSVFTSSDGVVVEVQSWVADGRTFARFAARLDEARAEAAARAAQGRAVAEHQAAVAAHAATAAPAAAEGEGGAQPDATQEATAPAAEAESAPAAPLAVTDPVADLAQRVQALRDEIDAIQSRVTAWTYVLPPYKAEHLNKPLESYLKPRS